MLMTSIYRTAYREKERKLPEKKFKEEENEVAHIQLDME